jgi:GT2 family glycosyltransferase
MIRRQALEEIGLLDEDYWLYTEEADWCFRARQRGWQMLLVPAARVVHVTRAASRQRFIETMLHFHRSRLLFLLKHRSRTQAHLAKAVICVKAVIWMIVPGLSPLSKAYSNLDSSDCRRAHRQLAQYMLLPLHRLVETNA